MLLQDPSGLYGLYRSTFGGTGRSAAPFLDELLRAESNLKEIEKRTRIIDIQQSRGDKIQKERRQVENEIARIDNRIAALRVEKALAEKLLLMTGKLRTIEERIADITNELRESDELIANIAAHGASIESRFPQFRDFTDQKKQNLKRLQETYREIRDIHVAQDNYFSARRTRFQKATGIIAITGSGGVALLYFLVNRGLLALPPRMRIYLLGGIAALLAIMTAVLYLPLFIPRRPRELVALQEARAEIEARLREILSENEIELHDYKLESVYGFLLQYFEEYGEYADGLLDLFRLREGLKSPEYLSSLQEERHELAAAAGARRVDAVQRFMEEQEIEIPSRRQRRVQEHVDDDTAARVAAFVAGEKRLGGAVRPGEIGVELRRQTFAAESIEQRSEVDVRTDRGPGGRRPPRRRSRRIGRAFGLEPRVDQMRKPAALQARRATEDDPPNGVRHDVRRLAENDVRPELEDAGRGIGPPRVELAPRVAIEDSHDGPRSAAPLQRGVQSVVGEKGELALHGEHPTPNRRTVD